MISKLVTQLIGDPKGQCYPASEAVYHLLGGKKAGLTPVVGPNHWWLKTKTGEIIDVTKDQFPEGYPYYHDGRGCGFLTKKPSKRAQRIIETVQAHLKDEV